jgi:MATE family, multidrug efflux pump
MTIKSRLEEVKPVLSESWSLGWPMILIMFFHFSIGLADAYVAGLLGTEILAAVGYVGQLYWTLMIVANALTVGTVSMISQAYGAGSFKGAGSITAHSLGMALVVSGILAVFAGLYPGSIVRMAGMPEGIEDVATVFIRIFSLVLVPTYFMIITGGVLRASDRVRVAMVNACVAALVNVVGDLVLAFGWGPIPAMGFRGIAWASAASTTLGAALNLIFMFRGPGRIRLAALTTPLTRCFRNLLKLGLPSAIQNTSWNVGTLVVYFLVGSIGGKEIVALAAMTGGLRIEAIIFLPIFALNMAAAVLTGNRLGAGDVPGARSGAKVTAALSLALAAIPILVIFAFAPYISGFLTRDVEVLEEMTRYLRIQMLAMPFMAVGVVLSGALQGAGDTFATMRIVVIGMWGLRIPFIVFTLYVLRAGPVPIWWAMTLSIVFMCSLLWWRFRSGAWTEASRDKKNNSMLWEACVVSPSIPVGEGCYEKESHPD